MGAPSPLLQDKDRQHVVDTLRDSGLHAPHGFIRGLDAAYDLAVHVDHLARVLHAADDYRQSFGSGESERWVFLERLPWDSEFFGRGIARLHDVVRPAHPSSLRQEVGDSVQALDHALRQAMHDGVDYVFASVQATDLAMIRTVSACGFELIETRCFYHRPLQGPPAQRYATRLATTDDVPSLSSAARQMVNSFDRFHADPAIPPEDADRLMETWVEASIARGFADCTVVPDVDAPEAFCTAKYHKQHWDGWGLRLAQPVLSAVSPKHKGWYVKIISELDEHLRSEGAEHAFLITQITNNAVIRCWEKLGYGFGKGEHVFRKLL